MKKFIGLLMVIMVGVSWGQDGTTRPVVVNVVGALPQDSLNVCVHYNDTTFYNASLTRTGFLTYTSFSTFTIAGTRAALLVADSTIWNTAATRGGLLVADSTKWNTVSQSVGTDSSAWNIASTRAELLVADSTKWNNMLPLASVYAAIDSFTTTGQTKDITIAGSVVGGAVIVTPMSPEYSTAADTGQQYSGFVKAGGGTIEIVRTNLTAASTIKSGAHFSYIYIKPR